MPQSREAAIITAATTHDRPAALVCVNLQNFKALNVVLGHKRCDQILAHVQRRLEEMGLTWRTGGDEFITILRGTLPVVTEQVKAFSWRFHMTIGVTEAWSFAFATGQKSSLVPWRAFQVVCTPRCGIVELGPDAATSHDLARRRCDDLRMGLATSPPGFAPLTKGPWTHQQELATEGCPTCHHGQPAILDCDLGWSHEHCARCDASYERNNVICVLGEESEAGYA